LISEKETIVLKRLMLLGVLALVVAAPAQAEGWKQLRVRGVVVSASADVVAVENSVGDAMLKCRVPERLADAATALKPGDRVRMFCHRKRGERAVLHKLERLDENGKKSKRGERSETPAKGERSEKPEKPEKPERPEKPATVEASARGTVAELGAGAIVVEDAESGRRLACKVSAEKAHKLEGVKVGERVKILCVNGQLAYLERAAAEEHKLYGTITALSSTSVSVTGDGRTLTCSVPGHFAEKLGRFAVGHSVKLMCRGAELTYLERV
jgi:hypothetical protein